VKTNAVLSYGANSPSRIAEVDLGEPRAGEILVRLVASGICHSDIVMKRVWDDFPGIAGKAPVVFGHEGAGVVEAVGPGVRRARVGDSVALSYASCRACPACLGGRPFYCDHFRALNYKGSRLDGSTTMSMDGSPVFGSFFGQSSFANHVVVNENNAVVVDPVCDPRVIAPFGCGVMTGAGAVFSTLGLRDGDSLAVFGAGGVGLSAVMAAKVAGVSTIIVVDPVEGRRSLATELGATHVFDPRRDEPVAAIRDLTRGGATSSLETSARADVVVQALDCLAAMGMCVALGFGTPEFPFTLSQVGRGRRLTSTNVGESDSHTMIPRLVEMHLAGELPVEKLVKSYPFAEFEKAVEDAESGVTIKPVLTFD